MTTKHTPGPWHVGHSGYSNTPFLVYPHGQPRPDWRRSRPVPYIIALVEQDEGPDHKAQEANARLIAAAPDLLAALRMIADSDACAINAKAIAASAIAKAAQS
jgi:hypothetical protein